MRDKISLVKDICKIIISVLIIGTVVKSCANATITESDIKNLIWAKAKNKALSDYQAQTICDKIDFTHIPKNTNASTTYSDITTYLNNENYSMVAKNEGSYLIIFICDNRLSKRLTCANDKSYLTCYYVGRFETTTIDQYNWNTTKFYGSMTSGNYGWAGTTSPQYYSPELPAISNINNSTSVIISAPHSNPSWFKSDGPYTDFTPYWVFARTGDTDIRIEGFTPTIRLLSRERINTYLGQLNNSEYCKRITATTIAYNKNEGNWNDIITDIDLYNLEMGDIQEVFSTTYHEENEGYYISDIKERSLYLPNNTVLMLGFYPKEEYEELYPNDVIGMFEYFYLYDNNTVLSGDYLDIEATFNNDFYDDYQQNLEDNYTNIQDDINNENIQNINDTLEEIKEQDQQQDSWWRNKVDELITIESGDINEIINNTFENIKLGSGEIAVDLQIIEYLTNAQPGDFIISWNNYQPNLTIKGVPIRSGDGSIFKSMGYMIPGNQINFSELERNSATLHSVMTWERIIINLGIIMILANQFYLVLLQLFGVATNEFGHNVEEKRILARQQEQEKAKIRSQLWYRNQEKVRDYERLARQKGWKK